MTTKKQYISQTAAIQATTDYLALHGLDSVDMMAHSITREGYEDSAGNYHRLPATIHWPTLACLLLEQYEHEYANDQAAAMERVK